MVAVAAAVPAWVVVPAWVAAASAGLLGTTSRRSLHNYLQTVSSTTPAHCN